MAYLARYSSTEVGLRRVLFRRIDRWGRAAADQYAARDHMAAAKGEVPGVVARMVELGLVNDAAFAASRARGLALSGRSRRAIAARLMAKGIAADQARSVVPDDAEAEFVSALILTRKRRVGPFRRVAEGNARAEGDARTEGDARKELGMLARAGFPRDVAMRALAMDPEAAEVLIRAARE